MSAVLAPTAGAAAPSFFLDRDHSILAFNERVLDWACRTDVPLLERLRYLCIVSSNLDEFFEVRAAPHLAAAQAGSLKGEFTQQGFEELARAAHALVDRQYSLYNDELMPAFAKHGIAIVAHGERSVAQRAWVQEYFETEVRPLLVPVGLDAAHPFPQVANKSLNFFVQGRLRAGEPDRDRESATRAAATHPHAGQGIGEEDAAGVTFQRDSRAPGQSFPRPGGEPLLAVSRHTPL